MNKIKDPAFSFKKFLFPPIITTSEKIIQIFKSLRVARIVLCLVKKVSSKYFAKRARYIRLYFQDNMMKVHYKLEQRNFEFDRSACAPLFESLRALTLKRKKFRLFNVTIYKEEMTSS